MKKITFLLLFIAISFGGFAQTLPNNSFEKWTANPAPQYEDPDSWNTPNGLTSLAGVVVVEKSDDAVDGNYSAELKTGKIEIGTISYIAPGLVTYADFTVNTETLEYGFSGGVYFPESVSSLSGMYKYSSQDGNDSATALIYMFRHPEGEDIDTIGGGVTFLKDTDEWTPFTINMVSFNFHVPDTFNVLFMSTATFNIDSMPEGSVLKIDKLSVTTTTGIFNVSVKNIDLNVFPNPAIDRIVFEATGTEKERKLNIFNISGQLVRQVDFAQKQVEINLDGLPSGNYSYRVFAGRQLYNSGTFIIR